MGWVEEEEDMVEVDRDRARVVLAVLPETAEFSEVLFKAHVGIQKHRLCC